jgi:ArsR family transcriptional regulator
VRPLADLYKALSDETRLAMLDLLMRHGELCVCDLVQALGVTQSKASRHLRHLAIAGLVDDRRDGLWVHYRIRTDPQPDAAHALAALRASIADRAPGPADDRLAAWIDAKTNGTAACRDAGAGAGVGAGTGGAA